MEKSCIVSTVFEFLLIYINPAPTNLEFAWCTLGKLTIRPKRKQIRRNSANFFPNEKDVNMAAQSVQPYGFA